ncbi:MAG: hypothetical protein C0483_22625 [Pirellula sp.]|nr:hypothetical protein [Pirellula sp.]
MTHLLQPPVAVEECLGQSIQELTKMATAEVPTRTIPKDRPSPIAARTKLNFLLDAALLMNFLALVILALIVRFVFPPVLHAEGWTLWEYDYDAWMGAWFNSLIAFTLLVLIHVMLHWSWVCNVAARLLSNYRGRAVRADDAAQTVYGVAFLIVLLGIVGGVVATAALSIQTPTF